MIRAAIISLTSVVIAEVLLGFCLAFVPAIFMGVSLTKIASFALIYSFYIALVASVIVIFIGMPIYALLSRAGKATAKNIGAIGFLIPVVILLAIEVMYSPSGMSSSGQNYYGTYRDMVIENVRTYWGWVSFIENLVKFGFHGLVGAIVFQRCWQKFYVVKITS